MKSAGTATILTATGLLLEIVALLYMSRPDAAGGGLLLAGALAPIALVALGLMVGRGSSVHSGGRRLLFPFMVGSLIVVSAVGPVKLTALVMSQASGGSGAYASGGAELVLRIARAAGAGPALEILDEQIRLSPELRLYSHHVAHETGRIAIERADFNLEVLRDCTLNFASGCVHGMIEQYFFSRPAIASESIVSFCDDALEASWLSAWKLECAHGLGHGLAVRSDHQVEPAIQGCDLLTSIVERRECHDGVFMEIASHTIGQGHPTDGTHAHGSEAHDDRHPAGADRPGDRCDRIGPAYRESCWAYEYLLIHAASGKSWSRAAAGCQEAGAPELAAKCVFGVGKQVAQEHSGHWGPVYKFCSDLSSNVAGSCISGAVEHIVDFDWTIDRAREFCAGAPGDLQSSCYFRLGARLGFIQPDLDSAEPCEWANERSREACVRGLTETRRLQASGA